MGRIDKWNEGHVFFQGDGFTIRWADKAFYRTRVFITQSVVPVTGLTVSFGGATAFFDTALDGYILDVSECDNTRNPVCTCDGLTFAIDPQATLHNTARWLLWGR